MQTNGKTPHQKLLDAIERDRQRLERHLQGVEVLPESAVDVAELDELATELDALALAARQFALRLAAVSHRIKEQM